MSTPVFRSGGGGRPGPAISNSPLYSTGGMFGGGGGYASPASRVTTPQKPIPMAFPMAPRITNEPPGLMPPDKPVPAAPMPTWFQGRQSMPVYSAPSSPRPFQGFGNDVMNPNARPPVSPATGGPRPVSESSGSIGGNTPRGEAPMIRGNQMAYGRGFQGFGNDVAQMPVATPPAQAAQSGIDWKPNITPYTPISGPAQPVAGRARQPQLTNNTSPNYRLPGINTGGRNEAGWWHQPNGYLQANGQITNFDQPGWWNQADHQGLSGGVGGGAGGRGGVFGGGGGYSSPGGGPAQAFIDAMNAANKANQDRYNEILGGYGSARDYAAKQLAGLGDQQRKDTNAAFDKNAGRIDQSTISRGLNSTTVQDTLQAGNARDRGEALARLESDLARERMAQELPLLEQQLKFMERRDDVGPDPGLFASLMQNAAAAGPGGAYTGPINLDLGGGGGFGFGGGYMPFMNLGGIMASQGSNLVRPGSGRSMLRKNGRGSSTISRTRQSGSGYGPPMVFGPGGEALRFSPQPFLDSSEPYSDMLPPGIGGMPARAPWVSTPRSAAATDTPFNFNYDLAGRPFGGVSSPRSFGEGVVAPDWYFN